MEQKSGKQAEPVAWRCKDYADEWILYGNKAIAELYQAYTGCLVEPLYAHPPQPSETVAEAAPVVSPEALIDLIGELGSEVYYLLDDCETSGPVGEEVHTITDESLTKVSAILDRIEALPFEEPGVILGVGAMLQAAIKQTFQTHPPQPSETVAEAAVEAAFKALPPDAHGTIGSGEMERVLEAAFRAQLGRPVNEALKRMVLVLDQNDEKGPIPDTALMFCWMAAQDVRAALRALKGGEA